MEFTESLYKLTGGDTNKIYDIMKLKSSTMTNINNMVLYNDKEELDMITEIYPLFYKSNPLHPDVFPELSVLEKNIIQITKKLFSFI